MSLQDGKQKLYRQTTVGYWFCMFVTNSLSRRTYWFCMFVTNSLSRRTVLQINYHIDPLHRQQTLTLSQCNSRDLTDTFTHKSFYTQTVSHTDASTHRHFYTQMRFTDAHTLSHTDAFTHRRTTAFTHGTSRKQHGATSNGRRTLQSRNFFSVFDVQRPFRAKRLRRTLQSRNFSPVFDVQRTFRA